MGALPPPPAPDAPAWTGSRAPRAESEREGVRPCGRGAAACGIDPSGCELEIGNDRSDCRPRLGGPLSRPNDATTPVCAALTTVNPDASEEDEVEDVARRGAEALPPASCTALPAPLRRGSLLKESPASLPRWLLASLPARPFAEAERGATAEWVLPRPSGSGVSQGLAVSSGSKARWPSLPYTETQPP